MANCEAKIYAVGSDGCFEDVEQIAADDEICANDGWFERPVVAIVDEITAPLPTDHPLTLVVDKSVTDCRSFGPKTQESHNLQLRGEAELVQPQPTFL
jgi:hypothetical protein